MLRSAIRSFAVGFTILMLLVAVVPTLLAQGTSDAAALCTNGGFLNYTNSEGVIFKNTGECVKYAAQGNDLLPVAPPATLTATYADGYITIEGSGLMEGAVVTYTATRPDGTLESGTIPGYYVASDGTFYLYDWTRCGYTNAVWSSTTASGDPISTEPGATQPCV